ncbi:MMPL family transporter [Aeromicrobium sp. CF3.5]|uniref:MMPL family transporter n=1 Tax=Aeromicrobium sp. CF3.5 TaxID=3373078 RepID=UPI003EE7889D
MSMFLYRLGRWSYRARRWVAGAWVLLLLATVAGSALLGRPPVEGFSIPGTEAQEAMDTLGEAFPEMTGSSAQVIVVAPDGSRIDDEPSKAALGTAVRTLGGIDDVVAVSDPFDPATTDGMTDDGTAALVSVQLGKEAAEVDGATLAGLTDAGDELRAMLPEGSQVSIGGEAFAAVEVPHDNLGEIIGIALAFLVLLVTFGSFVAAGLPLITAVGVVGVTLTAIGVVTSFADISSTAPVLATMLGLAVGIDYALFVLSRHVRQLREGMAAEESVARSVATAGSAVVFAGLTVVIALVGLAIVNIPFLTVMGVAAGAAVGLAVVMALTLTPALLGFSSGLLVRGIRRREAKRVARARHLEPDRSVVIDERKSVSTRFFSRWVRLATVRPLVTIGLVVGTIGLLSVPALDLRLGLQDAGSQPRDSSARQTYDLVAENFGPGRNGSLLVTGSLDGVDDPVAVMGALREDLLAVDSVASIPLATPDPTGTTGLLTVVPQSSPDSDETKDLVAAIRSAAGDLEAEHGVALSVTGAAAAGIDVSALLSDALVPYIAFIVILSLILLTMVFRSIWVPLKATVGFLLTIGSALGSVALAYSWGWFAGPLGIEQTGPVISFMPIIVLGVLFGLAMDYEVFLVSAIREDYVHGAGAQSAIMSGFSRSAPIVTAAALIMFAVFATFVPAADSTIKPIALALAVGVFVDAFVVRMTFVPAVMTLLGDRAWSMPAWLDRLLPSFDVEGEKLTRELASSGRPVLEQV